MNDKPDRLQGRVVPDDGAYRVELVRGERVLLRLDDRPKTIRQALSLASAVMNAAAAAIRDERSLTI